MTAVVITRRDPRGLAALLDAVLDQTLAPDAVVVLDRTAGAVLREAAGPENQQPTDPTTAAERTPDPTSTDPTADRVTLDHSAVTVAASSTRPAARTACP